MLSQEEANLNRQNAIRKTILEKRLFESINSPKLETQRRQLDCIDTIHQNQQQNLKFGIDKIKPNLKKWEDKNEEPTNYEIAILKEIDLQQTQE